MSDRSAHATASYETRLAERRATLLGSAYRLFYEEPVHFVRGSGALLYDSTGESYLDAYNNVPSVGHCHPHVVAAVAEQMGRLNTHTRYLHDGILAYVERLLALFPASLDRAMLTCSGSEANDLALQLARAFTGNEGFIATECAYHGNTTAVSGLSPSLGSAYRQPETTRLVPAPDGYRRAAPDAAAAFAAGVEAAIADLARHGLRPAALIVDPIFSSDGVFADPAPFLAPAVDAVRSAGGIVIADEVQAGFGRTGAGMWGFERHDLVPDLVSLGKPMGNGYPLAGVVGRDEVMRAMGDRGRYFNTFGGTPAACAAGMAVLDVIEQEGLVEHTRSTGAYLIERLRQLAAGTDAIGDVRGAGLFVGLDIVVAGGGTQPAPETAAAIVNGLRRRKVLVSHTGPHGNVVKVRPPLVFTREHVDTFLATLGAVVADLPSV